MSTGTSMRVRWESSLAAAQRWLIKVASIMFLLGSSFAVARGAEGIEPPQAWRDDFSSRAAGSDGAPAWEPQAVGWQARDGAYVGDNGSSVWQAVPLGAAITFSCDVTVLEQLRGDWLVAGIGLASDEDNYWALNLVVAPEPLQRRHSAELHESLSGKWLADTLPESRLAQRPSQGGLTATSLRTTRSPVRGATRLLAKWPCRSTRA